MWVCLFWTLPINGTVQYGACGVWLLSLSSVLKVHPHCGRCLPSFLLRLNTNSTVHKETTCCLSIHPLTDTWEYVSFLPAALIPVLPGHLGAGLRVILTSDTGHAQFSWPLVDIHLSELSKAQLSCGDVIYRRNRTWTGEGSHL